MPSQETRTRAELTRARQVSRREKALTALARAREQDDGTESWKKVIRFGEDFVAKSTHHIAELDILLTGFSGEVLSNQDGLVYTCHECGGIQRVPVLTPPEQCC